MEIITGMGVSAGIIGEKWLFPVGGYVYNWFGGGKIKENSHRQA